MPMSFLDLSESREIRDGHSFINRFEVDTIISILKKIQNLIEIRSRREKGKEGEEKGEERGGVSTYFKLVFSRLVGSVGVISPYKSQVSSIREKWKGYI